MKTYFLYCFIKKWFQILVYHFKSISQDYQIEAGTHHFAENIFKSIFLNENCYILIKIWLKFVTKGSFDKKPALVQIMTCRQTVDKPLSEPMMAQFTDVYMYHTDWLIWSDIGYMQEIFNHEFKY